MENRLNILGVGVDNCTMNSATDFLVSSMDTEGLTSVYTPNSEIILHAYKNPDYCEILNRGSLITADGIGVVYASKILGQALPERVSGFDLANKLLERSAPLGKTLYLFGGKPGVAEKAAEKIVSIHPGINIVGVSDGYFDAEKEKTIIADINEKSPDILFVCLGFPKQECWIDAHRDLKTKVAMGIGGSLDVFAGEVKRAPVFFQKAGLEWFYRLIKQPSRFIRMLALPKFGLTVLFHGKKFLK
ncbi:MAG: WecB/TagA/CpsF family glycosyltransferase [Clostridia bacterium]|nr:WecB/TagA/CpsF family glycosyltransferase [Clostridia bacterium]